jgi:peptidoglycan/xylan/chitin deacetylase (PgdA/CDA1 family)
VFAEESVTRQVALTVLLSLSLAFSVAAPASASTGEADDGLAPQAGAETTTLPPSLLVRHGSRRNPIIALTFDFGGRSGDAKSIMRWLTANDVPATIFIVGTTAADTAAGRRVMALAAQRPDLFVVGNHSWNHPNYTHLTSAQIGRDLRKAEQVIAPLSGHTTKPWFRAPYGLSNNAVLAAVGAAGWSRTVVWDVGTDDWIAPSRGGPSPEELVREVLDQAQNGSIAVMHLNGYSTRAALPAIVAGLRTEGLTPVTLDTLLGR